MSADTHQTPTLRPAAIRSTDNQVVLEFLNDSNDIFKGALRHRHSY